MPSFSWWSGNAFIMMTIVAYGEKKKLFLLPAFFVFYSRKLDAMLLNFCCWHIVLGHWIWFKTIFILLCVASVRNPILNVETRICLFDDALNWKFSCLPEKCKKKKNWWQKLKQFHILATEQAGKFEISTLFAASAVSPFASHVIFLINNNKKFPISSYC